MGHVVAGDTDARGVCIGKAARGQSLESVATIRKLLDLAINITRTNSF